MQSLGGVKSALIHGLMMIDPLNMNKVMERIQLAQRVIKGETFSEANALAQIPTITHLLRKLKPHAASEQKSQFCKELMSTAILNEVAGKSHTKSLLSDNILLRARLMQEKKYAQEAWIKQRDPAFTPDEIEEMPGEELDGPLKEKLGYCLYIQVKDKDFKHMADPDSHDPDEMHKD